MQMRAYNRKNNGRVTIEFTFPSGVSSSVDYLMSNYRANVSAKRLRFGDTLSAKVSPCSPRPFNQAITGSFPRSSRPIRLGYQNDFADENGEHRAPLPARRKWRREGCKGRKVDKVDVKRKSGNDGACNTRVTISDVV